MSRPHVRTPVCPRAYLRRRIHRTPRGALGATVAVTTVLALLAGCSAGSTSSATNPDSLSVGFVAEPASLDFTTDDGAAIPQALLVNVYEGLVKLDGNGKIAPLLAKKWELSPDRKTYTFTLQDDATFSNGKPFTAKDAVFSINRVKNDWTTSLKKGMDVVENARALSRNKLEVRLSKPSNNWLFTMTTRVGAMFSRSGVSDLATKPIGTGPYELQKWTRGDRIVLKARDDYWGKQPGSKELVLRYFKDANALNNALSSNDIDVISTVQAPESLSQFSDKDKYRVIEGLTSGEVVLAFNHAREPFDDRRVRRAISHAIDHRALLNTAWAGRGKLIGSMVTPTDPWYEDLAGRYPYNPKRARQLLSAAGVQNPTFQLRIPSLPYAEASAQVIKSQLKKVGVTAKIDVLEFPARWLDEVFTKTNYDMSIVSHVEPRDIFNWGNSDYYWNYDNLKLRRLFAKADRADRAGQIATMKKAARLLSDDATADWLFLLPNLMVSRADVEGLPTNVVSEAFDMTQVKKKS